MQPTNKSSGIQTADVLLHTGKAIVAGVQVITDGANDAQLILYDNTAASGTQVFNQKVTGTDDSMPFTLADGGIRCDTGLYADISGTGASFIVYYR